MKKRIIAIFAVMLTLVMVLASCASLDTYKKNLGSDYKIEIMDDEDDIEDMEESFGIKAEKYGVTEILSAVEKEEGDMLIIVKCGSGSKAKKLAKKLEDKLGDMGLEVVFDGRYVLAGSEDAIEDALGD